MEDEKKELADRISKIREVFCGGKNKEFARMLGMTETNASSYCNGYVNAGKKTINRILQAFPRVNKTWLTVGEGEMLIPNISNGHDIISNTAFGNNNVQGREIHSDAYVDTDKLIAMLESRDRQIDRLITLLEQNSLMSKEKDINTIE